MTLRTLLALHALLLPHGGQQRARRNAWAGMSRDGAHARDRQESARAVAAVPGFGAGRSAAR